MSGETLHNETETPFKIDPLSPFYLGSHDIPGIKISSISLTYSNYEDWSRDIRMSLKSRRKYGFCDGSITKPTDKNLLDQWEVVNCTVVRWIRNMIDPSVISTVPFVEDASILWRDLSERFAVVDSTSIHSLKTDLAECKQLKGMSITEYYGKLKTLWDALAVHEPPFACKCGRCICDIVSGY
ncbi:uncharacterized protein LOC141608438 [Silene latifolia]|uniref:uncharacterized protein LOC141608438 n=1 Tax=Silene latifolia TaxID=37657 RepID=UPI003D77715A